MLQHKNAPKHAHDISRDVQGTKVAFNYTGGCNHMRRMSAGSFSWNKRYNHCFYLFQCLQNDRSAHICSAAYNRKFYTSHCAQDDNGFCRYSHYISAAAVYKIYTFKLFCMDSVCALLCGICCGSNNSYRLCI